MKMNDFDYCMAQYLDGNVSRNTAYISGNTVLCRLNKNLLDRVCRSLKTNCIFALKNKSHLLTNVKLELQRPIFFSKECIFSSAISN